MEDQRRMLWQPESRRDMHQHLPETPDEASSAWPPCYDLGHLSLFVAAELVLYLSIGSSGQGRYPENPQEGWLSDVC